MTTAMRTMGETLLLIGTLLPLDAGAETKAVDAVPRDASVVIKSVIDAVAKRDLVTLRKQMVDEFTWSFGGDTSADQAIEEWKNDPRFLTSLQRVLRKGCRPTEANHVECPGAGGVTFRAGFVKTTKGWMMEYFVAGD